MIVEQIRAEQCSAPPPESKVYVLVRRDLPWPVRCVQAVHAVMALQHHVGLRPGFGMRDFGPSVVLLGVKDELEINAWAGKLYPHAVCFYEPDLCGQLTSLAYYGQPIPEFNDLRLM